MTTLAATTAVVYPEWDGMPLPDGSRAPRARMLAAKSSSPLPLDQWLDPNGCEADVTEIPQQANEKRQ